MKELIQKILATLGALSFLLFPQAALTAEEAATAPKASEPAGAVSKVDNVSDAFDELFKS